MLTWEHSPVASSSEVLGGALVFRGTRVPAQTLLDYLNDGFDVKEFLEFFRRYGKPRHWNSLSSSVRNPHENHL